MTGALARAGYCAIGCFCLALPALAIAVVAAARDAPNTELRTESFDKDPGWEGFNNHIVPKHVPIVTQDFGYSPTHLAAKQDGELGGRVTRCTTPAYYAQRLAAKSLDDKLSAAGTFALTKSTPGSGVFFGWFRAGQPGGSGRPVSSLGLHFDGEAAGGRLAVRLIGGTNRSCGTFVTPFIPGKFRPTPIRNDGTRYQWTLDYDPQGAGGRGQFKFTLRGDAPKPGEFSSTDIPEAHKAEARRRFPDVTTFTVDLPEGFRQEGATFDRFGLMNMTKPGGWMTIHFGDLNEGGKSLDLSRDPNWDGSGNHASYADAVQAGAHNFGFSPTTHLAGGAAAGEIGGDFWRSGQYAYYADRVGPLTLDDRLEARGKVVLPVGSPDSDMYLGWFDGASKDQSPAESGNFLGVHVGGPTRFGHCFSPALATAKGTRAHVEKGPVLVPGKGYDWSLVYDPAAEGGKGTIRVTLGEESVTLPLKPGHKAEGGRFDRFGMLTSNIGGSLVRVYLDDLKYTAAAEKP
jgi:hypothetical protein